MSIEKKSLISNRIASKKAIVTKPEVSQVGATKLRGANTKLGGLHTRVGVQNTKVGIQNTKLGGMTSKVKF